MKLYPKGYKNTCFYISQQNIFALIKNNDYLCKVKFKNKYMI